MYSRTNFTPQARLIATLIACVAIACATLGWRTALAQENVPGQTDVSLPDITLYDQVQAGMVDTSTILIGVEPGTTQAEVEQIIHEQGWQVGRLWLHIGIAEAHIPADTVQAASAVQITAIDAQRAILAEDSAVRYAVFDGVVRSATATPPPMLEPTPNDPRYPDQWALHTLDIVNAWNIAHGDPQITVAVIDSGYNEQHEDIDLENIWTNQAEFNGLPNEDDDDNGYIDDIYGWDWVEGDNHPNDLFGHGTHVLGVIAGSVNNQLGITSIGRGIKAAPLRILDSSGSGQISSLIAAMEYARANNMQIINLSLVIPFDSEAIHDAIIAAKAEDRIVVAAVGNTSSSVQWPAAYAETVAVAATDQSDERASFSNRGPEVDIAAPGVGILSTHLNNSYRELDGTSMATPHVSALAGLIWGLRPDLTADGVLDIMTATAVDVNAIVWPGRDDFLGHGRIDPYQALLSASTGVALLPDNPTQIAQSGQPFQLEMQVTTDQDHALPVTGAVVSYEIISETANAATSTEPAATSAVEREMSNGQGSITFQAVAPVAPGDYLFRIQHGEQVLDIPLLVLSGGPISVSLELSSTVLQVDSEGVLVQVNVDNEEGTANTLELPLHLETDLGTFGNGLPVLEATVRQGVYHTRFDPGFTSGTATIQASIGGSEIATATVHILPGPAAQLDAETVTLPDNGDSSIQQFQLQFTLTDKYNNPATDGTTIQLFTSAGVLAADTLATVNGAANVIITVPTNLTEPIIVWATVPGTLLEKRIELSIITVRAYLPFIR